MRNVHEFDGKLPIQERTFYTQEEMKKIVDDAGIFLQGMRVDARLMTDKIIHEGKETNMDTVNNNADAKNMFLRVLQRISTIQDKQDQKCFYNMLEEQLCDMKNLGPCPQGRTVRLWQLLQCLE